MKNEEKTSFLHNFRWIQNITVVKRSPVPVYKQIANFILIGIAQQMIFKGDALPSINQLSAYLNVSRATIEQGYNSLKVMGYIDATRGKGFFVSSRWQLSDQEAAPDGHDLSELYGSIYDLPKNQLLLLQKFVNNLCDENVTEDPKLNKNSVLYRWTMA
ncbi:GntR family transcriptional regulator [Dyadobacter sp. 3J3]|uniref:GntR family transcriptional regulator n=1 Tax=Dyadobacter sp. 3J3 TaxID=2606600 RepID=UPI00135869C7|nr:winged helix-turn-helix domain-containing protein [Dyadobacter sp. 3J3]